MDLTTATNAIGQLLFLCYGRINKMKKKLLMKELERIQIKCKRFTIHKQGFMVEIFAMYENISDLCSVNYAVSKSGFCYQ